MEEKLRQQGNQADKFLHGVYREFKQSGIVPSKSYEINLSEDDAALLNAANLA